MIMIHDPPVQEVHLVWVVGAGPWKQWDTFHRNYSEVITILSQLVWA